MRSGRHPVFQGTVAVMETACYKYLLSSLLRKMLNKITAAEKEHNIPRLTEIKI